MKSEGSGFFSDAGMPNELKSLLMQKANLGFYESLVHKEMIAASAIDYEKNRSGLCYGDR